MIKRIHKLWFLSQIKRRQTFFVGIRLLIAILYVTLCIHRTHSPNFFLFFRAISKKSKSANIKFWKSPLFLPTKNWSLGLDAANFVFRFLVVSKENGRGNVDQPSDLLFFLDNLLFYCLSWLGSSNSYEPGSVQNQTGCGKKRVWSPKK